VRFFEIKNKKLIFLSETQANKAAVLNCKKEEIKLKKINANLRFVRGA
jgi:hypothetical protein